MTNRARWFVLTMALALPLAGCGNPFASEGEELQYLQSRRDLSPAEWKRKQALEAKADREEWRAFEKREAAREHARAANP
jgi:hypothetical protein